MKDDTPDNNIHPKLISLRNTVISHLIKIKTHVKVFMDFLHLFQTIFFLQFSIFESIQTRVFATNSVFYPNVFAIQCRKPLIFQTVKFWNTPSVVAVKGIRKLEFEATNQFRYTQKKYNYCVFWEIFPTVLWIDRLSLERKGCFVLTNF